MKHRRDRSSEEENEREEKNKRPCPSRDQDRPSHEARIHCARRSLSYLPPLGPGAHARTHARTYIHPQVKATPVLKRSHIAIYRVPAIHPGRQDQDHVRPLRFRRCRHRHRHHHRGRLRGNAYSSAGCAGGRLRPTKSRARTGTSSSCFRRLRHPSSVGDAGCRLRLPRASLAQTAASRTSAAALGSRTPDRDLPRWRPRVQTRSRRGHPGSIRNEAA